MTNISVLPLTQKAPFTKGCLLAVNGYLLATFNISDSGERCITSIMLESHSELARAGAYPDSRFESTEFVWHRHK